MTTSKRFRICARCSTPKPSREFTDGKTWCNGCRAKHGRCIHERGAAWKQFRKAILAAHAAYESR